jgi:hypothetical protein
MFAAPVKGTTARADVASARRFDPIIENGRPARWGRDRAGLKDRRWRQGKKPADGGSRRHRLFVGAADLKVQPRKLVFQQWDRGKAQVAEL